MHRLRLSSIAAVFVAFTGCSGGGSVGPSVSPTVTTPAPSPAPPLGATSQQVAGFPIAHVIVITMENRTPDNLFSVSGLTGGKPYPGADATPVGIDVDGKSPIAFAPVSLADARDPGHAYSELVADWNNGQMNGFANANVYPLGSAGPVKIPNFANAFVPPNETILYHQLAYQYAMADRMFSSRLVASFPGHQFLIAGQSGASENPPTTIWGCDSPAGATAPAFGPPELSTSGTFPCYDYRTVGDLLDAAGVSWKYYSGPPGTIDGNIDAYGAIQHIRFGADFAKVSTPLTNLNADLQNCTLPSVAYINAPTFASDHSATLSAGGPGFVGDIYLQWIQTKFSSLAACQYLNNTAIIVTWDDSGGWADHVVPPKDATGASYGMRVPLLIISPYAKSGYSSQRPTGYLPYVSHVQHDYGSIIRFIEKNFGLTPGALGQRDAQADDLGDMFAYNSGQPVPPVSGLLLQQFRRETADAKRRISSMRSGMPVDDDK